MSRTLKIRGLVSIPALLALALAVVAGLLPVGASGASNGPTVTAAAATADGQGWWLVDSIGTVTAGGDAHAYGSLPSADLSAPIVGIAPTPDGHGYWLVSATGGVFSFGDAAYHGSATAVHLAAPIVAIASTPTGNGYWLAGRDGGVFADGVAPYHGSAAAIGLAAPIVAIASTPTGNGYWLAGRDGGVFAYGDAPWLGSDLSATVATLGLSALSGGGYALVRTDGRQLHPDQHTTSIPPPPTPIQPPATPTALPGSVDLPGALDRAAPFDRMQLAPPNPVGVGLSGTSLTLNGVPHKFVGVDAYELGTEWGVNAGCGGMVSDAQLDRFFASLPPGSLVRIWGLQGTIATNHLTHQLDWGPLERVFSAAAAHGQYLVVSLGGLGGVCDNDHWAQPSWYAGGFRQVYDDNGLAPLPYASFVQAIVEHFKGNPALGMWEPYSEAEASTCAPGYDGSACMGHNSCPNEAVAARDLRYFFDQVGTEIHAIDPTHPVEEGLLGGPQCGESGTDWEYLAESPGIDVLSYHDYDPHALLGGDGFSGIPARITQAEVVLKPVIAGEIGVRANPSLPGCDTLAARASLMRAKIHAQLVAGAAATLVWNWELDPAPGGVCSYNVGPGDPILSALWGL
jgi:hypothetical protein